MASLAVALSVGACASREEPEALYKSSRIVLGTLIEVTVRGRQDKARAATQAVFEELKRVEESASFHKPSTLMKLNEAAGTGPVKVDEELVTLVSAGLKAAQESGGAYDPTVGAVSRIWHFSGDQGPRLPAVSEIEEALTKVGWDKVAVDAQTGTIALAEKGMALDLGGIAKGYSLDRARDVLERAGISAALVNAGGDVLALGEKEPGKPWRIGVQDPRNLKALIAVASVKDRVVLTSGDYERFFMENGKRYHHILDPKSGYPASKLQSVTLLAPRGIVGEPLAVSVFVKGVEEGIDAIRSVPGVEGLLIDAEGQVHFTPGAESQFELRPRADAPAG
ncbi:MAG: FAD:protein FMN transferase [Desulfomonile tiedjei]|nr:FAD:protein FMN transferase [Desulfomonile tiedjei]